MSLPNALTAGRIVLTMALYVPAFSGDRALLLWGFVLAFATDLLDGYLARRLGQTSYLGMRLDSLADYLLMVSGLVWAWWLEPGLFREHSTIWASVAVAVAAPQAICLFRVGKNAGFHLYSTKAAGWAAAVLFVHAVSSGSHSELLLYFFALLVIVKSTEETAICLLVPDPYKDLRPSALSYLLPPARRG